MSQAFETTQGELVMLWKEVAKQRELSHTRKARKMGKGGAFKDKFAFNIQEVLDFTQAICRSGRQNHKDDL